LRLETKRLILRPIDAEEDFLPWAQMMGDATTTAYLWDAKTLNPAQAWQNMVMNIGHWQVRGFGFFSVVCKQTSAWVGRVGPYFPRYWPAPEIGWAIHPKHKRNGYATEAATACLAYVFDELNWPEVTHVIVPGNTGSIAVAQKIGSIFWHEVLDQHTGRTRLIYGQTRK